MRASLARDAPSAAAVRSTTSNLCARFAEVNAELARANGKVRHRVVREESRHSSSTAVRGRWTHDAAAMVDASGGRGREMCFVRGLTRDGARSSPVTAMRRDVARS